MTAPTLSIVATSFNRRQVTLAALMQAQASARAAGIEPRIILVDASSTDDTARAVSTAMPAAEVITVGADHYWAMGMRVGMAKAALDSPDYVMWVNDDTVLYESAVLTLLAAAVSLPAGGIVVGAIQDESTGERTYGGLVNTVGWGLRLTAAPVQAEPVACDAGNGNVVLISSSVIERIGLLDARFTHGMADWDFALRARRKGLPVVQAAGFVGTCSHNSPTGGWRDQSLTFQRRVRLMLDPKGLPPSEWVHFQLRHGRLEAPVNILRPWLRLALDEVSRRRRVRAATRQQHQGGP